MSLLDILIFPDKRLRKVAAPVEQFDDALQQLIDNMFETMYDAPGIGLAATQVNVHQQVVVMDLSEAKNEPQVFINPVITKEAGTEEMQEGCLSIPGAYETIQRSETVTVEALDREGKGYTLDADGLLAVCIQHEIDHLQGKLFVDYLSPLKKNRIRKKMEKFVREQDR
ncbi:MAG: peptide deformylase [Granulosicoccaceae bacterium]